MIHRGDVWWAELAMPRGSGPGYRRPVAIVQADAFSRSRIGTVIVVAITSNMSRAEAPGNVLLSTRLTGLPKESVANVSQLVSLDRTLLTDRLGKLPRPKLGLVLSGLAVVLGR